MEKIRLEYSEKQQCFHYDNGSHEKNSNGYYCLCDSILHKTASEFCNKMHVKYPKILPSFEIMKRQFEIFLLT